MAETNEEKKRESRQFTVSCISMALLIALIVGSLYYYFTGQYVIADKKVYKDAIKIRTIYNETAPAILADRDEFLEADTSLSCYYSDKDEVKKLKLYCETRVRVDDSFDNLSIDEQYRLIYYTYSDYPTDIALSILKTETPDLYEAYQGTKKCISNYKGNVRMTYHLTVETSEHVYESSSTYAVFLKDGNEVKNLLLTGGRLTSYSRGENSRGWKKSDSSTSSGSGSSSHIPQSVFDKLNQNKKSYYVPGHSTLTDPEDYDNPDDFADDAWGVDFDDWDAAYDYWEDY